MCVPPSWSFPDECSEHHSQELERGGQGFGPLGFTKYTDEI